MAYYNVCPKCGCNLDPGEHCDCENIKAKEQEESKSYYRQYLRAEPKGKQLTFSFGCKRGGAVKI